MYMASRHVWDYKECFLITINTDQIFSLTPPDQEDMEKEHQVIPDHVLPPLDSMDKTIASRSDDSTVKLPALVPSAPDLEDQAPPAYSRFPGAACAELLTEEISQKFPPDSSTPPWMSSTEEPPGHKLHDKKEEMVPMKDLRDLRDVRIVRPTGETACDPAPHESRRPSIGSLKMPHMMKKKKKALPDKKPFGFSLGEHQKALFICYVEAGSPACDEALSFGDQVVSINNQTIAQLKESESLGQILKKKKKTGLLDFANEEIMQHDAIYLTLRPNVRRLSVFDFKYNGGIHLEDGIVKKVDAGTEADMRGLSINKRIIAINGMTVAGEQNNAIELQLGRLRGSEVSLILMELDEYKSLTQNVNAQMWKNMDRTEH